MTGIMCETETGAEYSNNLRYINTAIISGI